MIDPYMVATLGLGPGFETFHCITLGYYFYVEVTITSIGLSYNEELADSRKEITILVGYKSHYWKKSLLVNTITIDTFLEIKANFIGFIKKTVNALLKSKRKLK